MEMEWSVQSRRDGMHCGVGGDGTGRQGEGNRTMKAQHAPRVGLEGQEKRLTKYTEPK